MPEPYALAEAVSRGLLLNTALAERLTRRRTFAADVLCDDGRYVMPGGATMIIDFAIPRAGQRLIEAYDTRHPRLI